MEQWPEGGDKKRMYAKHFFFRAQRKEMTAAVLSQCAVQVSFCRSELAANGPYAARMLQLNSHLSLLLDVCSCKHRQ